MRETAFFAIFVPRATRDDDALFLRRVVVVVDRFERDAAAARLPPVLFLPRDDDADFREPDRCLALAMTAPPAE
jgi:hypothetical protein